MTNAEPLFSKDDIISVYTHEQGIEDGILVDVTDTAREAGWACQVVMTRGAWEDFAEWTEADEKKSRGFGQSVAGRLWDVVWMARYATAAATAHGGKALFRFSRVPRPGRGRTRNVLAQLVLGQTFSGKPLATILLPNED